MFEMNSDKTLKSLKLASYCVKTPNRLGEKPVHLPAKQTNSFVRKTLKMGLRFNELFPHTFL